MKRLIMCAVMSVGVALAGMFGVSGYIEADAVTGVQSQQLAQVVSDFAVEPLLRIQGDVDGTNYVDAMRAEFYTTNAASQAKIVALQEGTNRWNAATALAATALQPAATNMLATALQASWSVTGTVANAERLVAPDGSLVWTEIIGGTNWQYQVTNTVNVYVSAVSGDGYNGPPVGTVWTNRTFNDGTWEWTTHPEYGSLFVLYIPEGADWNTYNGISQWEVNSADYIYRASDPLPLMPCMLDAYAIGTVGMLTLSWLPVTNRTQIATQTGTVILISEHNESTDASIHPTLPRSNDVVNIVGAATDPLLSKADAAATYLPTANIPGPGCTDLGTGMTVALTGATTAYMASPTGTVTLAVSESAPRYSYALELYGTNAVTMGTGLTLFGSWTPAGTNIVAVVPSTGEVWRVYGRGI